MHLYFIPRGIKQQIEIFEKFMQTQMFPWKRKNLETGKEEVTMVQGAYRDCGMFKEYVFPRECLNEVLEMMGKENLLDSGVSDFKKCFVRKLLGHGVKKIPKKIKEDNKTRLGLLIYDDEGKPTFKPYRYIERRGVAIHFIGIKEDRYDNMPCDDGVVRYQEML